MEKVKGDKNHTGYAININDITLQDFIGLIINQSKLQNIEPIQALNAFLNYVKKMQPEELQQRPILVCDIDYTIKNKIKERAKNVKHIYKRGTKPKKTKSTKPKTDTKAIQ